MSSTGERTGLPPVKKRTRFSTPPPPIPTGFVRYDLDEEDTDDDPDFVAELDVPEEEDDVEDALVVPGSTQFASRVDVEPAMHLEGMAGEPHFDVDDLDSTDEESVLDGVGERQLAEEGRGEVSGVCQEDVELVSDADGDEGDDALGAADEAEQEDDNDSDGEDEGPDNDYAQFLMALLSDQGDANSDAPHEVHPLPEPVATDEHNVANAPVPTLNLDDDDDFDYLRELARVQDDPLEFREDLQVSRKELVQLLFGSKETNLRRQTRYSRARTSQRNGRGRRASQAASSFPVVMPAGPQVPLATAEMMGAATAGAYARRPGLPEAAPLAAQPERVSMPVAAAPPGTFMSLPAHVVYQFQEQMTVYVQILTTLHAETKRKSRVEREQPQTSAHDRATNVSPSQEAADRSEALVRTLIRDKQVSAAYHELLQRGMSRLKCYAETMLQGDVRMPFAHRSYKSSVYNLPALNLLEDFLSDCQTNDLAGMPASALQKLAPFSRPDIAQALRPRLRHRQYTVPGSRPGWLPWTLQDDHLLAMTMAKYGNELGGFTTDLLPHRLDDDCQARVRYLSSRRCPDNAVKRQVMFIASPLNREEVELVRRGLERYGGVGLENADVWKRIQREYLPRREWSHLQKLWLWRETRRKYKAKYRARASEKKKALGGSTAHA